MTAKCCKNIRHGVVVRISTSKINELNQTTKINGFVIYDEESHKLIGVPEYGISTDMVEYLDCAFAENKALEKLWNNESISQFRIVGGKPGEQAIEVATHSGALFIELLEYCIIHKLSLHLSEFFNNSDDKKCVREFSEMTFQRFCLVIGSLSFFQRIWLIVKFLLVTMPPWEITKILGQSYMLGTRPVGIMIDLI